MSDSETTTPAKPKNGWTLDLSNGGRWIALTGVATAGAAGFGFNELTDLAVAERNIEVVAERVDVTRAEHARAMVDLQTYINREVANLREELSRRVSEVEDDADRASADRYTATQSAKDAAAHAMVHDAEARAEAARNDEVARRFLELERRVHELERPS